MGNATGAHDPSVAGYCDTSPASPGRNMISFCFYAWRCAARESAMPIGVRRIGSAWLLFVGKA